MRIKVEVDEALIQEAMRYSTARSKRALVEEALRTYVDIKTSERRSSSYRDRLASIRGRTTSLRLKKSATDIVRADRSRT